MRLISLLMSAALMTAGGCSNGFDPAYHIGSLRLLDVMAEPAEVAGGGMTTMKATWANPGKAAPVTINWDFCALPPPPGSGSSTNDNCIQPDMAAPYLIPIGTGDSVAFTMPQIPLGETALAQLGLLDDSDGFYVPIRLRLTDGTQHLTAVFSLRYYFGGSSPNMPNKNPGLMGLYRVPYFDAGAVAQTEIVESMPPDVHSGDVIDLRALLAPDAQENYVVLSGDLTKSPPMTTKKTETVSVSWLVTAGELSNNKTGMDKPNTTWTLDKYLPAPGTPIDLWLVARDERGGSSVLHRSFNFK